MISSLSCSFSLLFPSCFSFEIQLDMNQTEPKLVCHKALDKRVYTQGYLQVSENNNQGEERSKTGGELQKVVNRVDFWVYLRIFTWD